MFYSVLLLYTNEDPDFTPVTVVCKTLNDDQEVRRMALNRSLSVSTISTRFIYLNDFPS